jgi:hypothetical protein
MLDKQQDSRDFVNARAAGKDSFHRPPDLMSCSFAALPVVNRAPGPSSEIGFLLVWGFAGLRRGPSSAHWKAHFNP